MEVKRNTPLSTNYSNECIIILNTFLGYGVWYNVSCNLSFYSPSTAIDSFLTKYGTSIVGYFVVSIPIFWPKGEMPTTSQLTQGYVRNRQLLIELAAAIRHILLLSNKLTALAGSVKRVTELLEVIHYMKTNNLVFEIKSEPTQDDTVVPSTSVHKKQWLDRWRKRGEALREKLDPVPPALITTSAKQGGLIIPGKFIKFENVSLVSPEGKLLVHGAIVE